VKEGIVDKGEFVISGQNIVRMRKENVTAVMEH
jgi:hypothetical protein